MIDTSSLINRPLFLNELISKFDEVIIPDIVIAEINHLKDNKKCSVKQKASLVMKNIENEINNTQSHTKKVFITKCNKSDGINDEKIAQIAIDKAKSKPNNIVYMLSDDIYFKLLTHNVNNIQSINTKEYIKKFNHTKNNYDIGKCYEFLSLINSEKSKKIKEFNLDNVDINFCNPDNGYPPIIMAVRKRNIEILNFILTLPNLEIDKPDKHKYAFSAIHHATQLKDLSIIQILAKHGADIDFCSKGKNAGNTPLMVAAWSNFLEGVDFFIEQGACVNQQDSNGYTPLIKACINNNFEIIKKLVSISD